MLRRREEIRTPAPLGELLFVGKIRKKQTYSTRYRFEIAQAWHLNGEPTFCPVMRQPCAADQPV